MTQPFTFTMMEYLETECPLRSLPTPMLEWLEPTEKSTSLVQLEEQTVEKTYINGSKQYRMRFDIITQGNAVDRLTMISDMAGLQQLFQSLPNETSFGDGLTIRKVETTTPSLRAQTENGVIRYGFSATIVYKD